MKLILASGSPRRSFLLKLAGIKFTKTIPKITERVLKNERPSSMVRRLSKEKALHVFNKLKNKKDRLILSADTIVVGPDKKAIIGKPKSHKEAKRMLSLLSGKTHFVITGFTLLYTSKKQKPKIKTYISKSGVKFRTLSEYEITEYSKTKEPMDKAGAYAVQGQGMHFIDKVYGSYTNVVGLPMGALIVELKKLDIEPKFK